jgi:ClpP class serine protease
MTDHSKLIEKRLAGVPLAISQQKLEVITSEVTLRLLAGDALLPFEPMVKPNLSKNGLSIVNVSGSLVAKNGFFGGSGSTSYESIVNQTKSFLDSGAKEIYFNIDSGGGEVAGLFATSDYIASLEAKGIKTIALVDGMACSAAYALAAACSEVYATNSSELGSIAVITSLVSQVEADAQRGYTYTILRSKDKKSLGNPHEAITPEALASLTTRLSEFDTIFNSTVNKYRPQVSITDIISWEGETFLAEEALSLGLIDKIIPSVQMFLDEQPTKPLSLANAAVKGTSINLRDNKMEEIAQLQAKIIQLQEENHKLSADKSLAEASAKQAEQARCLGILSAADTFGSISLSAITKQISAGFTQEQVIANFEMLKEATQKATALDTSTAVTTAQNVLNSPVSATVKDHLVAAAEKATSVASHTRRIGV